MTTPDPRVAALPMTSEEIAALRQRHRPCDCNNATGTGIRAGYPPEPHCVCRTGNHKIEPWCDQSRLLAALDAATPDCGHADLIQSLQDALNDRIREASGYEAEIARLRTALDAGADSVLNHRNCRHDFEGHDWGGLRRYLVRRWSRAAGSLR